MLDLDAIDRRAKDEVAYARQVNASLAAGGSRPPTFEALVRLPASQVLALVARVRELEVERKRAEDAAMLAYHDVRNNERKRCADLLRKQAAKMAEADEDISYRGVIMLAIGIERGVEAIEHGGA